MSETAIKFENISKQYRLGLVGTGTITHDLNRWWHVVRGKEDPYLKIGEVNDRSAKAQSKYIWALKDISFDVKQGEVLGIIGKNGAGKSTLLKILSRVTSPSTGTIKAKGRIASLLEVGTGFHPELTGRENIFMNGSIMGMTKAEIRRKLDEIVDFAGVEKYIDTPVKRYSSGMTVRLGFAIAAHLEPEILVVDEVLAVGDAEFQKKAIGKMKDVSTSEGRTVLFVSHQLNSVQSLCNQCILMENGKISSSGSTSAIISQYLKLSSANISNTSWYNTNKEYENEFCSLLEMSLVTQSGQPLTNNYIENNQTLYVKLKFHIKNLHSALCVGFSLYTANEQLLFWSYQTDMPEDSKIELKAGDNTLYAQFPKRMLNEGEYFIKPIISLHHIDWIINPEKEAPTIGLSINGGLSDSILWQEKRPGLLAPVIQYKDQL
ncbi:ATP-binding cassette domain-containing protein [Dysgonomonas sp. 521]|uniref:ABC transporter ATP-binding protein n=1 Tax=Dysgonomonas sp. 521 TaxID=2302932 RepID=UPI0013D35DF4|nr:polysaccharide ABC transporter ATP-binding protein [Dysgonomonas sp. 521]NDV95252.1 ATP-binding cassette domain-containing protein [Dysgonomonas sp. 521]